jgi:hypothetical protein
MDKTFISGLSFRVLAARRYPEFFLKIDFKIENCFFLKIENFLKYFVFYK